MPKPAKSASSRAAKGNRSRSDETLRDAVANDVAAFKRAARKAALADADEISKQYEAASKKIAGMTEKLLKVAAGKSLDAAEGEKHKTAKAEIAAMKAEAIRALSRNTSRTIGALLNDNAFKAHDPDETPPKWDQGKRADRHDEFDSTSIDGADTR